MANGVSKTVINIMLILAVDLGSTNFKAAVFDNSLTILGAGSCPLEYRFAAGGCVELDAGHAVEAFDEAARGAIASADIASEDIHCVTLTSQAQTFTVVDSRGQPKIPFISWQDTRAGETCRELADGDELADFGNHASFGQLLDVLQVCQLAHIRHKRPDLIEPDDSILHLSTFLARRLIGHSVIDRNLAAMSGLYSLIDNDWWPPALAVCGLATEQLASLVPIGAITGQIIEDGDCNLLPPGIPVVLAGNDQTSGAYGAALEEGLKVGQGGALLLTLGTALVAYACTAELAQPSGVLVRGPYPTGLYYRLATDSGGGAIVNWAKTVLQGCASDAEFSAHVEEAQPGCQGLIFDADLPGGRGAWRNLAFCHTSADMARAVIESLSRRMAELVDSMELDLERMRVLAAGGGSRSKAWVSILSQTMGCPIEITDADPLRGAARMGRESFGGT
ncbi:MAG: FGGY-family carbohydrate kinase [Pirellulales bacterium]|nr:FGGY-family carbohydrate kinase [Pirellulales bacterium]